MKGVRVISGRLLTAVLIDGMSWPLPEIELLDRLLHGPRSEEAGQAAASLIRATVFEYVTALRAALASERERAPKCAHCPNTATCLGRYESSNNPWEYACDTCCGHGNEDGRCVPLAEVPDLVTKIAKEAHDSDEAWASERERAERSEKERDALLAKLVTLDAAGPSELRSNRPDASHAEVERLREALLKAQAIIEDGEHVGILLCTRCLDAAKAALDLATLWRKP